MRIGPLKWCTVLFWLYGTVAAGQIKKTREYKSGFQLSLFPGISTNGIRSGEYLNKYSLNIFGGLSSGNRYFELGFISNVNLKSSTGIQVAGFANVVGANAFINLTQSEERQLIQDGFESSMTGIQLAGMLNYIRSNARGIQISGGMNDVVVNFSGFQLAGIGNSVGGFAVGIQLSGLYNTAFESVAGLQISALLNTTRGELHGLQLGLINKSVRMKGRNSTPPTRRKGIQVGLINGSKSMHGLQMGLVNFGGSLRGKQIGLINFFDRAPSKEHVQNGTPIGLLNFGSKGSVMRMYLNEIFTYNLEYTTGNCQNCSWTPTEMPITTGRFKTFNQNALIVGYDQFKYTWGFGYGFMKIHYNKASVAPHPRNEKRLLSYGLRFIQLNPPSKLEKRMNLITKLHMDLGLKYRSIYFFVSASANYFINKGEPFDLMRTKQFSVQSERNTNTSFWPGYAFGIQLN